MPYKWRGVNLSPHVSVQGKVRSSRPLWGGVDAIPRARYQLHFEYFEYLITYTYLVLMATKVMRSMSMCGYACQDVYNINVGVFNSISSSYSDLFWSQAEPTDPLESRLLFQLTIDRQTRKNVLKMSKQIVGAAYSNDDKNAIKSPSEPPQIPLDNRFTTRPGSAVTIF